MMRSPSLLAVSLLALSAPELMAASSVMVADDSMRLSVSAELATRAERATARDAGGNDFDATLDRPGRSDALDFSVRRARLSVIGSFQGAYLFGLGFRSDAADVAGYQNGRVTDLYKAWAERSFSNGDHVHVIHAGLDYAFFNRAYTATPYYLFPQARATAGMLGVRGVGVRYQFSGSQFDLGFDVMNSLDPAKPAANAGRSEGLFYSARLELSVIDARKPAYRESYAGDRGEGLLFAAEIGFDNDDYAVAGMKTNTLCYGVELLGHADGFSGLAELRLLASRGTSLTAAPDTDLHQRVFLVQAGYAVALDQGMAIEPAARVSFIDFDRANAGERVAYDGGPHNAGLDAEWGDSGRQVDLGLNLYLNRHGNKLQLSLSHWQAEAGDGKADIVRLQQQLFF